jgi:hypothetical protein
MLKKAMLVGALALTVAWTGSVAQAAQKVIVGDTGSPTGLTGRSLALFKERAEKYSNATCRWKSTAIASSARSRPWRRN